MIVNNNEQLFKKYILFHVHSLRQLPMYAHILRENDDFYFVLYSDHILEDDFVKTDVAQFDNVTFAQDVELIRAKAALFDVVISTNQSLLDAVIVDGIRSVKKAKFFEIQNALFQSGVHYNDLPILTSLGYDSLESKCRAHAMLLFYPVDGRAGGTPIGYPHYLEDEPLYSHGQYTLVLSNLHVDAYTHIERVRFYQAVAQLIVANPRQLFLWHCHQDEAALLGDIHQYTSVFSSEPVNNLVYTAQTNAFGLIPRASLIKKSKNVISTISTALLECEQYKRSTLVYRAQSINLLLDKIHHVESFADYDELKQKFGKGEYSLESGLLQRYNNDVFRDAIFGDA